MPKRSASVWSVLELADLRKQDRRRNIVQALWALLSNSYLMGFAEGKIYQGPLKNLCAPGLNCYSCPGAVASCPVGSVQAALSSPKYHFAFYAAGFLFLFGAFLGRSVCGWLCPFGLMQDLIYKIPFMKKLRTFRGDAALRYVKYGVLVVFVILLPMYATDIVGQGAPYFCKWICPAGTLEAGWPMVALNEGLRDAVGWLYAWKNVILAVTLAAAVIVYRPFCRYVCPLGAIYGCFNRVSMYRFTWNAETCIQCGKCEKACRMHIDPVKKPNSAECIRCGRCLAVCPTGALCSTRMARQKAAKDMERAA